MSFFQHFRWFPTSQSLQIYPRWRTLAIYKNVKPDLLFITLYGHFEIFIICYNCCSYIFTHLNKCYNLIWIYERCSCTNLDSNEGEKADKRGLRQNSDKFHNCRCKNGKSNQSRLEFEDKNSKNRSKCFRMQQNQIQMNQIH